MISPQSRQPALLPLSPDNPLETRFHHATRCIHHNLPHCYISSSSSSVQIGLFETDAAGRLTSADTHFRQIALGGGGVPVGRAPWANAEPHQRSMAETAWRQCHMSGSPVDISVIYKQADLTEHTLRFLANAHLEADGSITKYSGVVIALAEVSHTENPPSQAILFLLESSADPVIVTDLEGSVLYCNVAAHNFEQLAQSVRDQMPRYIELNEGARWRGEVALQGHDAEQHTFDVQVTHGENNVTILARDITPAIRLQAELAHLATHDALTGLPNRTLFIRKLSEAIERCQSLKSTVSVFFLDIDKLKDVNDSVGHENGDVLIADIGRRLVLATRPGDLVGRIGGDEFVILCEGLVDEEAALDLAERIRISVTGRVLLQGIEVLTGASVGVAMTRGEDNEPLLTDAAITLMRHADTAMYHAKLRGRSRCELYTQHMRHVAKERSALSASLEQALANDEFHLVYQPILSPYTQKIVAAEALLRWKHPTLGLLTPSSFIDLADESGIIVPIGEWVMRRALQDMHTWLMDKKIDRQFVVHVNVSSRQVSDSGFVERTLAALKDFDLQPQHLALEFGENLLINETSNSLRTLQSMKRSGVHLSIDDFGTGYSSLSHLRQCPADFLKLDGSFVRALGDEDRDEPIVRSIIQLAHSLGMHVIAEWVTTDVQLQRLRLLGCDLVQGYHIGRPVAATDFGWSSTTV